MKQLYPPLRWTKQELSKMLVLKHFSCELKRLASDGNSLSF